MLGPLRERFSNFMHFFFEEGLGKGRTDYAAVIFPCLDCLECSEGEMPPQCSDLRHNCHSNATCSETQGSFICACKAGFTGNGQHCVGE